MVKKLLAFLLTFAICLSFAACSSGFESKEYQKVFSSDKPADTLVAENEKFTLQIDENNMGLILTDKETGEEWSTTPKDNAGPQYDEFGLLISKHARVESLLLVQCKNFVEDEVNTYNSFTHAVKNGAVTYKAKENGIILNFHFAEAEVMIPLECTLTEKGLKLSVNPADIEENDNKVLEIAIAPFFCGVQNDTENSYLFVPSGSGAVIGVDSKSEQGDTYSAQVYGADPAVDEVAQISTKENIRMGVYGAKIGEKAVCAIIDGSEGSARIHAVSGSSTFGYSSSYATFIMRGYTNHVAQLFYEKVDNIVYSKKMIEKPISVTFCPLSGEDANYSGMAKCYREYLTDTYKIGTDAKDVSLSVRILGGTEKAESFLGIPYKTVYAATTLAEAEKIIGEIKNELGGGFAVQLKGYGQSGIDVGKIAGNYKLSENLGNYSELEKLFAYAKDNGVDMYFDFDIERFNKNSKDVSKFSDAATNAGELKAIQYNYDLAVRDKNKDSAYNLLSPASFMKVFEKVTNSIGKYDLAGLSFDTLSSTAYSDYIDKESAKFYSKNGFSDAAIGVINAAKEQGKKFMAGSANAYAAALSDVITESPVISEKSQTFLYDIPFYQMVFKGSVPITVQSINLSADTRQVILKAVESGSGLGYTVINEWDSSVINASAPYFYNSVFDDIKDDIFKNSKDLADYYTKVSGQKIISHTVLENGLRETVFENSVAVYVNYTDKSLTSPVGEVAPYDYLVTEK